MKRRARQSALFSSREDEGEETPPVSFAAPLSLPAADEPLVAESTPAEEIESLELVIGELIRRERARSSLKEYARSIDIPGAPLSDDPENEVFRPVETAVAKHHILLLDALQNCIEKDFGRLMVFMPPGSAKSTYASVVAPAWAMAKFDGFRVITTSYASTLAERLSRRTRSICRDPRHLAVFDGKPTLNADQRSVSDWQLANGSGMIAGGIQSGITGNRADLLVIDDPVAGREEADSPTTQKKTQDAYRDDLLTRLKPKASVVIIQTRWSENDLSGSILPDDYDGRSGSILCKDGQTWEVLNIPAECERADDPLGRKPGEFLWPEWFPEQHWLNYKNDPNGQRSWNSLYQQRPTAADGIEFKREWFQWYDPDLEPGTFGARPKRLIPYGGTDFATSENRGSDFTEHGVLGMDQAEELWFLDWWFGQKESDKTIEQMMLMGARWKCRRWAHEGGPIGKALGPAIRRAIRESRGKFRAVIEELTSIRSKAVKLGSFQAMAASGRVHLPLKRVWAQRLVDQLCAFPAGRYDDAADVAGLLGRLIDKMQQAPKDAVPQGKELVPFSISWLEYEEDDKPKIRFS